MLSFRILGTVEVVRDGEVVPLGPAKQRAFLVCLLLRPNQAVSTDRLIEELWGQQAASRSERNLQQIVWRLRKAFGRDAEVLVTQAPGYRIQLEPDALDAAVFERLLREVRGTGREDPAKALEILERGLALWRGPAIADFAYEPFAQEAAGRLEDLRAVAEEERVEALLKLGRHREAIPEVEALVRRYPLREHLRAQLMLALYRDGRQSEALNAFQQAKATLAAELGIDPGPELRDLEDAILRQDSELRLPKFVAATERGPATKSSPPPEPRPRRRRSRWIPVLAIPLLALAVVVGVVASKGEPTSDGNATPSASGSDGQVDRSPSSTPGPSGTLLLHWQEVGTDDLKDAGHQHVLGGTPTPSGYLMFGYSELPPRGLDAAAWQGSSDEGWQWERIVDDSFGGPLNQRVTGGVVLHDETIVLVGSDEASGNFDGAVWKSSSDGSWSRAALLSSGLTRPEDQFMRAFVVAHPLVAVGSSLGPDGLDGAVWHSVRGRGWVFQDGAVKPKPGDQEMKAVARTTQRLVAAGYTAFEGDKDAAIWISKDASWRRVGDASELGGPGDQQINEVTRFGSGFVAVGEETIDGDTNAAVWASADGREWERVTDSRGLFGDEEGDQRMYAVTASSLGLVAAGADYVDADHSDAAVWTSVDGLTWERLPSDSPDMAPLTALGEQEIKALIAIDGGFLALGSERGENWDAQAWVGTPVT